MRIELYIVVFGLFCAGCAVQSEKTAQDVSKERASESIPYATSLEPDTLAQVKSATVLIGNFEGGKLHSVGSGFVFGDGLKVATNAHVVCGSDTKPDDLRIIYRSGEKDPVMVEVNSTEVSIRKGYSSDSKYSNKDLAIVKVPSKISEPLQLGDDTMVLETMPVWAVGFPAGLDIAKTKEADFPSSTIHSLKVERIEKSDGFLTMIQVGGSTTVGNSGGCLVNAEGMVIGIVQAKQAESITFAVPVAGLKNMLTELSGIVVAGSGESKRLQISDFSKPLESSTDSSSDQQGRKQAQSSGGSRFVPTRSILADELLTLNDIEDLSARDLTLLRNEPFARRGYSFSRSDIRRHFEKFSWYSPVTKDLASIQRKFSRIERENIDFIKSVQDSYGLNW